MPQQSHIQSRTQAERYSKLSQRLANSVAIADNECTIPAQPARFLIEEVSDSEVVYFVTMPDLHAAATWIEGSETVRTGVRLYDIDRLDENGENYATDAELRLRWQIVDITNTAGETVWQR